MFIMMVKYNFVWCLIVCVYVCACACMCLSPSVTYAEALNLVLPLYDHINSNMSTYLNNIDSFNLTSQSSSCLFLRNSHLHFLYRSKLSSPPHTSFLYSNNHLLRAISLTNVSPQISPTVTRCILSHSLNT